MILRYIGIFWVIVLSLGNIEGFASKRKWEDVQEFTQEKFSSKKQRVLEKTLETLPPEILLHIFSYLTNPELVKATFLNSSFSSLTEEIFKNRLTEWECGDCRTSEIKSSPPLSNFKKFPYQNTYFYKILFLNFLEVISLLQEEIKDEDLQKCKNSWSKFLESKERASLLGGRLMALHQTPPSSQEGLKEAAENFHRDLSTKIKEKDLEALEIACYLHLREYQYPQEVRESYTSHMISLLPLLKELEAQDHQNLLLSLSQELSLKEKIDLYLRKERVPSSFLDRLLRPAFRDLALGISEDEYEEFQEDPDFQKILHQRIQEGNSEALYVKGRLLAYQENLNEAQSYLQQAKDAGNILACYSLGFIAETKELFKEARDLYQEAADQNIDFAQFALGNLLKKTQPEQAHKYYELAAQQGFHEAQLKWAKILKDQEDFEQAEVYYRLAANQHLPKAQVAFGIFLETIKEDNIRAMNYFRRAAKAGDAEGQYHFAYLCYLAKNETKAQKYAQRALNQEHPDAQELLDRINEEKEEKDEEEEEMED